MRSLFPALLAAAAALAAPAASAAPRPARVGILEWRLDAGAEAALEGFLAALRLAQTPPEILTAAAGEDEADARAAEAELIASGAELIVGSGNAAAHLAATTVRGRPVLFMGIAEPEPLGLLGGHATGVAGGVAAGGLLEEFRRAVPGLARVGVVAPEGSPLAAWCADALSAELEGGAGRALTGVAAGPDPVARASAALDELLPAAELIWLPPDVALADAAAVARALEGRGVPLAGSTRDHLEAGCAFVVRTSPRDQGALAAVQARRLLAGEAPSAVPIRRPARRLLEVNLPAARRLAWQAPLPLVAAADHVVPPLGARR